MGTARKNRLERVAYAIHVPYLLGTKLLQRLVLLLTLISDKYL